LDVSSPGVDRPLEYHWQYPKHIGRMLSVHTDDGTTYRGRLRSCGEQAIVLDCSDQTVSIPFSAITRALVELEW
jgi:ribosome maturation factor RimP